MLRIFTSTVLRDIALRFSLLVVSLSGLGIRVMQAPLYEFGNVPSSLIFGENLRSIDINFF